MPNLKTPTTLFFFQIVLALALLLFSGIATARAAERLRVATFNVQNYTLVEFRRIEGIVEPDYPKPEVEKDALRFLLRAANADVLALQEIGGEAFVTELRRDLAKEGFHYDHAAFLEGPDKRRQLAILSRRPFKRIFRHSEIPVRLPEEKNDPVRPTVSRGLLGVSFDTPAGEFFFYTLHLKSRLDSTGDPQSAVRRLAEAEAVCGTLLKTHPSISQTLVLLAGDFNDEPHSAPLRRFSYPKKPPALLFLPARDSRGETWTYRNIRNDYYSRSDYFLHSPALTPFVKTPAKIADLPVSDTASDHRLMIAELNFP